MKRINTTLLALTLTALLHVPPASARPVDRAAGRVDARDSRQDGRQGSPDSRQDGRQGARDSKQEGRQTSRARRHASWALPAGAVVVTHGGIRYHRVGAAYYYGYPYQGKTAYVQIEVHNGHPATPPPITTLELTF